MDDQVQSTGRYDMLSVAFADRAEPTNPMDPTRALLDHVPALRHTCDLDLLMFFARHPRALIASERLAELLGYQLSDIARSLEVLLDEGLLQRTQNPARAARLYVLAIDGAHHAWLAAFVELGSTRQGRLALRRALIQCPDPGPTDRTTERSYRPEPGMMRPVRYDIAAKPNPDEPRER
jgi:hypothetical protein